MTDVLIDRAFKACTLLLLALIAVLNWKQHTILRHQYFPTDMSSGAVEVIVVNGKDRPVPVRPRE